MEGKLVDQFTTDIGDVYLYVPEKKESPEEAQQYLRDLHAMIARMLINQYGREQSAL